ncbi:hypothetical protein BRD00_06890 [Halobacteriales archaeon QS_8_69_26]|nr:MAG: hypothetical protein BRD00_06890 [Halobacteriales archaeon QS_8_69_26]
MPPDLLGRYRRFSLYNSPYAAHDEGHAVDLYPDPGAAPSPVAGEVLDVRSVSAPPKPYAEAEDHLILIRVADGVVDAREGLVARVLHADPAVEPGEWVAAGEDLGRTIRSGFFAPWVGDHLHVGFRPPDGNHYRASGSLPVAAGVSVDPLPWDGRGTVVERGDTYAVLDRPVHPAPGDRWAGIATDGGGVLDGGFPHYDGGGILPDGDPPDGEVTAVELLGTGIGTATGRTVEWADRTVRANGEAVTGLSLSLGRDRAGAKLVCPDATFEVGTEVRVRIE